jgi:hypothetical protein
MLGAHYYPWYGKPAHSILGAGGGSQVTLITLFLGKYNSRDPAAINQHIAWAKSAGIDFFAMEWTEPHTWEDITLKEYYLPASKAAEIKFCILYDSYFALNKLGTLFSFNFNDRHTTAKTKGRKFLDGFEYLADTYFSDPRYLKIGDRPLPEFKMVLITTFNEWHEGTEIEPSQEYGSTYLELTELFSDELKGGRV